MTTGCKYCGKYCGGAHAALDQLRVTAFAKIFNPRMCRANRARGFAAVLLSLELRGYEPEAVAVLCKFAEDADGGGRKTVAAAMALQDAARNGKDAHLLAVADEMARTGFKLGGWAKSGAVIQ